jgi:ribosome-binding protein aMBF1 (putative translation factor)
MSKKQMPSKAQKPKKTKGSEESVAANLPVLLRLTRAAFDWSQADLAKRARLNQRAILKLEQGETTPRKRTVDAIRSVWRDHGVDFITEDGRIVFEIKMLRRR